MFNNVVLNPEDDPEIKYCKSFCKALPLCYPLTLNWTKIPCPCSKTMQPWREEHHILSKRYSNFQNKVYTATSIIQHATTLGDARHYPHYAIGEYLQILNGTINIDKTAASKSSVARTLATVSIDLMSMTDSGTMTSVVRTTLTVPIDLVNETDTVKDITIIPPINVRAILDMNNY